MCLQKNTISKLCEWYVDCLFHVPKAGKPRKAGLRIVTMKLLTTCAVLFSFAGLCIAQTPQVPSKDANEIVAKMFAHDRQQETLTQGYEGTRQYVLDNDKFHKHAELAVSVKCGADGVKHFEVVAEDGWKSANKHVLRKMLESETETSDPAFRTKTRLTPDNYDFSMTGTAVVDNRLTYVINVLPKRNDKYLLKGTIWVDAEDFALVRVEGEPARNPSFWTRKIHFVHQFRKDGSYWFPVSTQSVTEARIFGSTNVTIGYFDYKPNSALPTHSGSQQVAQVTEENRDLH
jgi:outer membrane lipoprotein-sorting protein